VTEGQKMIGWMKDMWDFPRSLTGHGVVNTLNYLKLLNSEMEIHKFSTGEKVGDWLVPEEWNIYEAYLEHESGARFAEFTENNLHVVGYSEPCNIQLELVELLPHIHTLPNQPDVIPYVTSYYNKTWGFCMSENDKKQLPNGQYKVVIDSTIENGSLLLADMLLQGKLDKEVLFSTYICHPSMANNELSGPVLSAALAQYIKSKYPDSLYSYRFVFVPETIGSIAYISSNLERLKQKVICGVNLSCVGDERSYSHVESRLGGTLADKAIMAALKGLDNARYYPFLERGSDERQYCAPGIDLPFAGFCRTKYMEYPEYHTSADNFDVVTAEGLEGSLDVMMSIIDAFEVGLYPKIRTLCEPQLGARGIYPLVSQKGRIPDARRRLDFIAYSDGNHSLFDIALKLGENLSLINDEAKLLKSHELITVSDVPH